MPSLTIPEIVGAMVLPGCVLFPQGAMPLHIFEPRYRKMLTEALEGDCLFALFQLTGEEDPEDLGSFTASVGTVGLIRASREAEDGTSQLVLHGVLRVKVIEWIYDRPFPRARIMPFVPDDEPDPAHEALMIRLKASVKEMISDTPEELRQYMEDVLDRADNPHLLADVISQQFIGGANDRQTLLDESNATKRLQLLIKIIDQSSPPPRSTR